MTLVTLPKLCASELGNVCVRNGKSVGLSAPDRAIRLRLRFVI